MFRILLSLLWLLAANTATAQNPNAYAQQDVMLEREIIGPVATIFGTQIYLLEHTARELENNPTYAGQSDTLIALFHEAIPAIEAAAAELGGRRPSNVYLGTMYPNTIEYNSAAETTCAPEGLWLGGDLKRLRGAMNCTLIIEGNQFDDPEWVKFTLAHEMFHAIQAATFDNRALRSEWWSEGSADWFAQKAFPGRNFAAPEVQEFQDGVGFSPVTAFSYEAQVFHFWAEQRFDPNWILELGDEEEVLMNTARGVARIMEPVRWLDWASAQLHDRVMYPDGRGVPAAEKSTYPFGHDAACAVPDNSATNVSIPGLVPHLMNLVFSGDTTEATLEITAGDTWMRIFTAEGPIDLEGGELSLPLNGQSQIRVAAIIPSGIDGGFRFEFMPGESEEREASLSCGCAPLPEDFPAPDPCIVGAWAFESGGRAEFIAFLSSLNPDVSISGEVESEDVTFCANGRFFYEVSSNTNATFADGGRMDTPGGIQSFGTGQFVARRGVLEVYSLDESLQGSAAFYTETGTHLMPFDDLPSASNQMLGTYECGGSSLVTDFALPDVPAFVPSIRTVYSAAD